jgi:hypothetical protein
VALSVGWVPCSGRASAAGLVWLPRLLEKARRSEASQNRRLVDGYCYGDNDFIDKQLMTFLRTDDATVSTLVREHSDDNDVATILVARSGRTPAECAAFAKKFSRKFFDFVLLEADEGRLRSGPKATILKFLYNTVMMPVVYRMFLRDERNRKGPDPALRDTALKRR